MRLPPWFLSCGVWLLASGSADHEEHAEYEWAGIFEVPEAVYMWTAQKVDGAYADAAMKMAVLPAAQATPEALAALAEVGARSLAEACAPIEPGGVIAPRAAACYQLRFDESLWQSVYAIDTSAVGAAAFFTEHAPTEFESTAHYLKDSRGQDVEPLAELPEAVEQEGSTEWAGSLGAAVVVNLITLVGVLLTVPAIARLAAAHASAFEGLVSAFAAGAILACAFFLLLFEATHLIAEGWDDEVAVLWRWGAMTLAGFLLPAVIDGAVATAMEAAEKPAATEVVEKHSATEVVERPAAMEVVEAPATEASIGSAGAGSEEVADPSAAAAVGGDARSGARLIGDAVTIGDFFRSLCGVVFLGPAFMGCGGWGRTISRQKKVVEKPAAMEIAEKRTATEARGSPAAKEVAADPAKDFFAVGLAGAGSEEVVESSAPASRGDARSRARLIGAVTIGDFFHNLCDGFFLGAAFRGCGGGFGWGVALATVLHELPQELADYAVLTGGGVGMSPSRALLLNFLVGLSVVLGVLIFNMSDVDSSTVGLLLAFGGGVYVYIAAVECMPKVHRLQLSARTNLLCLLAFAVGATMIGLILLDHEHCVPEGEGHHAHGH